MKKDILTKGIAKMISSYKNKSDEEFIEILSSGGIVEASQDVVSTDSPVKAAKKKSRQNRYQNEEQQVETIKARIEEQKKQEESVEAENEFS